MSQKRGFRTECCWSHNARVRSPVAGPLATDKLFNGRFLQRLDRIRNSWAMFMGKFGSIALYFGQEFFFCYLVFGGTPCTQEYTCIWQPPTNHSWGGFGIATISLSSTQLRSAHFRALLSRHLGLCRPNRPNINISYILHKYLFWILKSAITYTTCTQVHKIHKYMSIEYTCARALPLLPAATQDYADQIRQIGWDSKFLASALWGYHRIQAPTHFILCTV